MAGFTPSKKNSSNFNNGNKYVNGVDSPNADDFNNVIESQLYTQALATNIPDTTDAGKVGTPTVEIDTTANGTPRLKFSNLKGEKGQDGTDHSVEINDLYTRVEENARQINTVKQVMLQNEEIVMLPIEEKYTVRKTANGANIFDKQYTPVVKVEGSTVKNGSELKHAYFVGIKSTGRNLIPYPYAYKTTTINGVTFTDNGDGSFVLSGTSTGDSYLLLATTTLPVGTYYISDDGDNDFSARFYVSLPSANYFKNSSFTITDEPTVVEIRLSIYGNFSGTATFFPMLNFGETALTDEPYVEDTLSLEKQIELAEWDTYYPEKGLVERRNKQIELTGNENWRGGTVGGVGYSYFSFLYSFTESGEQYWRTRISTYFDSITDTEYYSSVAFEGIGGSRGIIAVKILRDTLKNTNGYVENGTNDDNIAAFQNYIKARTTAAEPFIVESKMEEPISTETVIANAASYKALKDGMEVVLGNGANPKITQTYIAKVGGEE